jgi:hypothetical protein
MFCCKYLQKSPHFEGKKGQKSPYFDNEFRSRILHNFYFAGFTFGQIWLIPLVDVPKFTYFTKLEQKILVQISSSKMFLRIQTTPSWMIMFNIAQILLFAVNILTNRN